MKSWYAPHEIIFSKPQMLFLIENLCLLKRGVYPPECRDTGYTGLADKRQSHHAPFEIPCIFAVEVEQRLDCCSTDGEILVNQIKSDQYLSYEAKDALRYISGWGRKDIGYRAWLESEKMSKIC